MNCHRCGATLSPEDKFCLKCGNPAGQGIGAKAMPKPVKPQHQLMPKPGMPQPGMPQRPSMPKPGMPQLGMPQRHESAVDKGLFTNAVRTVANAITGGALNREISAEQNAALRQQARDMNEDINDANRRAQEAAQAQLQAEREAERAADRRSMEVVDGIEVVRGRAIWNIQPGEIARRIKESELEAVEKLKGIIVQEGCTALIYANGEQVAALSAGAYLFYKSVEEEQAALKKAIEDAEKHLEEAEKRRIAARRQTQPTFRELGIFGEMGRAVSWVGRILFGERKKGETARKQRQIDYARILSRLTQPPVLAVYIVSNRQIPLTFAGMLNQEGNLDFHPYTIPMGIQNVEIGVSLDIMVDDVRQLAVNYLGDKTRFTTTDVYNLLNGSIESALKTNLRNVDYEATGLPLDLVDILKAEIKRIVDSRLHGLRCVEVNSISDSNADFDRFRNVERQLYNTERELDFMQRTGEFRNRMEVEANAQQIQAARSAEDLRYSLQQINVDKILHDDELEAFVELTESQRRIRTATTAEEEQAALDALKKNRLVRNDEIEALEDALAHNKIPREEITQLMRIQSQLKLDQATQQAEWALSDAHTDHDWERQDLERRRNWGIEDETREREWMVEQREYDRAMGRRKSEEEYDFQQMLRNRQIEKEDRLEARNSQIEDENRQFERERMAREDEERFEANRHQRNIEKLQAMSQMQAAMDAQRYQHDENITSLHVNEQMNRDNTFANMSAEQIRAAQLAYLSEEAQVAMANSYSRDAELEAVRTVHADSQALMQQMMQMQQNSSKEQMAAMMQMAGMIKDTATGVSGAFHSAQQGQIDQLQNEKMHQQLRNDHLQDTAIENISKVSTAAASNINAFNGGLQMNVPTPNAASSQSAPQPAHAVEENLIECECYNCGHSIKIAYGVAACPDCGAPFQW